jgi:hypothetical protein
LEPSRGSRTRCAAPGLPQHLRHLEIVSRLPPQALGRPGVAPGHQPDRLPFQSAHQFVAGTGNVVAHRKAAGNIALFHPQLPSRHVGRVAGPVRSMLMPMRSPFALSARPWLPRSPSPRGDWKPRRGAQRASVLAPEGPGRAGGSVPLCCRRRTSAPRRRRERPARDCLPAAGASPPRARWHCRPRTATADNRGSNLLRSAGPVSSDRTALC